MTLLRDMHPLQVRRIERWHLANRERLHVHVGTTIIALPGEWPGIIGMGFNVAQPVNWLTARIAAIWKRLRWMVVCKE